MPRPEPGAVRAPATPPSRIGATLLRQALPVAVFLTSLAGCTMAHAPLTQEAFARKIDSLLAGKDAVEVEAAALTDFTWDRLCFERDDRLLLKFKGDTEQVLSLPYEEFFVDEGHVERSLEDACVAPGDRIVVRKKYPGYEGPIEFQKPAKGG